MRILFVSGTSVGGAARSTHELASALEARGHEAATLMRIDEARRRAYVYKRLVNLTVKLGETGRAARAVASVSAFVGRRMCREPGHGARASRAAVPENAAGRMIDASGAQVVVVNSVEPRTWRRIHSEAARRDLPTVLYMREETALRHLEPPVVQPDLLLSNAHGHARRAESLGYPVVVIPSMVDTRRCRVDSSRERVVLVNPIPDYGLGTALDLAATRPDVPFTLVESWPMNGAQVAELEASIAGMPNVELQRYDPDPRRIYERARVLLVPYAYENRPRVVLEAQASGIPVLAVDRAGPAEAVGPGGYLVAPSAPLSEWCESLARLWDDDAEYERLSGAALAHASRAEVDPEEIVGSFEAAVARLVTEGVLRP